MVLFLKPMMPMVSGGPSVKPCVFTGDLHDKKKVQIGRIMQESAGTFNHAVTARRYIELYERMLQRPLVSVSPY